MNEGAPQDESGLPDTSSPASHTPLWSSPVLGIVPKSTFAGMLGLALLSSFADSATVFLIYVLGTQLSGGEVVDTGISGTALALVERLADALDANIVLVLSGLFLASIVVRHGLRILGDRWIIATQFNILKSFSRRLFHGYFRLSYESFVERNSMDRINSITGETTRAGSAVNSFLRIPLHALSVVVLLLLLLAVDGRAFAFGIVAGVLLLFVVRPIARKSRAVGLQIRGATRDLWMSIMEPFRAYRVIATTGSASVFERDVERRVGRSLDLMRAVTYSQQKQAPIMELTIGAMIFIGILLALSSTDDPSGAFPLVLLAISGSYRILPAVSGLNAAYNGYRFSEPALHHVMEELADIDRFDDPPGLHDAAPATDGSLLHLDQVTFQYRTGPQVLRGINLVLPPATRIGIVGPSGSGKSTLIDLCLGLLRPTSGEVRTARRKDGTPLRIGYVPQQLALVDGTVLENLCLGEPPSQWDRLRAQQLLDQVGLGAGSAHPIDLDAPVAEGGLRLSGGQRQRLGLARAMYSQPDLLVLDEPTAALDEASEAQVMEAVEALAGMPMLLVTHRERPLQLCDRVLRIDQGRLVDVPATRGAGTP